MLDATIPDLPLYPHLDRIAQTFAEHRVFLLSAEPGAGKTTLLPWHLLRLPATPRGRILLLQPRRLAARAAAERIAALLGEKPGGTVGLRTRQETIVGRDTRLEVVTEGILVRILQRDQSLDGYATIIFDEFHERSIQADLGLALAWDCREQLRHDLGIIIMSATLEPEPLVRAFGEMPVLSIPGRTHPVEVRHLPPLQNERVWEGAARLARAALPLTGEERGDILVFLPGFYEIRRAEELLAAGPGAPSVEILHGRLAPERQRLVLAGSVPGRKRVILATNVAETSLTIPGVGAVVDCGLERRVRFSSRTGMDHWETVRISAASAVQRAGRAGRLGPGICLRWWRADEVLTPFARPAIEEADLAQLSLETAAWGAASPLDFRWITPPPVAPLKRAQALLAGLELVDEHGVITPRGKRAVSYGMHPRLARMIEEARARGSLQGAALVAALLEEGDGIARESSDFRDRVAAWRLWTRGGARGGNDAVFRRVQEEALRILRLAGDGNTPLDDADPDDRTLGLLLLLAYPDRLARKTDDAGDRTRWLLVTGRGARTPGPFTGADYIVAPEMDGGDTEGRIFTAIPVDAGDIERGTGLATVERETITWKGWRPQARGETRIGAIVVSARYLEKPRPDPLREAVLRRLADEGLASLPWDDAARRLLARCRYIGKRGLYSDWPDFSEEGLRIAVADWLLPFADLAGGEVFTAQSVAQGLAARLGHAHRSRLDGSAPESLILPSGTRRSLDYESGDVPVLAARLQEFFGCIRTPEVAGEPVLVHLLSPAGRPVQVTRDLGGFWERAYPEVKKELRGRYPRHYWPDNPLEAEPTNRAKPRHR